MNPIEVLKSYKASWQTDGMGLRGVPTVVFESRSRVETPAQPRRASVVSLEAPPLHEPSPRPTLALDEPQERFDLPSEVPAVPGEDQPEDALPFRPALPCCLYPATSGYAAVDLPAHIQFVFYPIIPAAPHDPGAEYVDLFYNAGLSKYTGTDSIGHPVTAYTDGAGWRITFYEDGFASDNTGEAPTVCLSPNGSFSGPPSIASNADKSLGDTFSNTYSVDFGGGVTANVTRIPGTPCKWTGTASDSRAVLLQYKQATLKWRLNGRNKDANQGSPTGAYGPWTVS